MTSGSAGTEDLIPKTGIFPPGNNGPTELGAKTACHLATSHVSESSGRGDCYCTGWADSSDYQGESGWKTMFQIWGSLRVSLSTSMICNWAVESYNSIQTRLLVALTFKQ